MLPNKLMFIVDSNNRQQQHFINNNSLNGSEIITLSRKCFLMFAEGFLQTASN